MKGRQVAQPHNGEKNLDGKFPPGECHSPHMVSVLSPAELRENGATRTHRVVGEGLWLSLKR